MEETETVEDSLQQIGQDLRTAREAQKLDLAEVAEAIHVNLNSLKALEEGDFHSPPGPVFMRGFMRSYANYIGVDTESLQQRLSGLLGEKDSNHTLQRVKAVRISEPPATANVWTKVALGAIVLAVALIVYLYLPENTFTPEPETVATEPEAPETPEASAEAAPTDSVAEAPEGAPVEEAPAAVEETAEPEAEVVAEAEVPEAEAPAGEPEAVAAAEAPEAEAPAVAPVLPLLLKVEALEPTWVGIAVDDQTPIDVKFDPSDTFEWEANSGFQIIIGNSRSVLLSLDGKSVPLEKDPPKLVQLTLDRDFLSTLSAQ